MTAGYTTIFDNIMGSSSRITIVPMKISTLTGFPINPKDDIDPVVSNSTTSTTTRRTTTTTPIVKVQTKKPPRRTTPMKSTQQAETKETPFISKITSTTKYVELQDRSGILLFYYTYIGESIRKII